MDIENAYDWLMEGIFKQNDQASLSSKEIDNNLLSAIIAQAKTKERIAAATNSFSLCLGISGHILEILGLKKFTQNKKVVIEKNKKHAKIIDIAGTGSFFVALDLNNNALHLIDSLWTMPVYKTFDLPGILDENSRICRKDANDFLVSYPSGNKILRVDFSAYSFDSDEQPSFDPFRIVNDITGPIAWVLKKSSVILARNNPENSVHIYDWNSEEFSPVFAKFSQRISNCFSLDSLLEGQFGLSQKIRDSIAVLVGFEAHPYLAKAFFENKRCRNIILPQLPFRTGERFDLPLISIWEEGLSLILYSLEEGDLKIWTGNRVLPEEDEHSRS